MYVQVGLVLCTLQVLRLVHYSTCITLTITLQDGDPFLQILLHDQTEFPLMEDEGFAVAPGTHTSVVVDKNEAFLSFYFVYSTCNFS